MAAEFSRSSRRVRAACRSAVSKPSVVILLAGALQQQLVGRILDLGMLEEVTRDGAGGRARRAARRPIGPFLTLPCIAGEAKPALVEALKLECEPELFGTNAHVGCDPCRRFAKVRLQSMGPAGQANREDPQSTMSPTDRGWVGQMSS